MTLKIHIYQDTDPPEISSSPDDKSCGTALRSLTGMSIYTVKSSKSPILQVQSIWAIFGLDYNIFYIETELPSLNSSQSESGFCQGTLLCEGFKQKEFFLVLDNSEEFKFDAKNSIFIKIQILQKFRRCRTTKVVELR